MDISIRNMAGMDPQQDKRNDFSYYYKWHYSCITIILPCEWHYSCIAIILPYEWIYSCITIILPCECHSQIEKLLLIHNRVTDGVLS
jgi:hypothetical protein